MCARQSACSGVCTVLFFWFVFVLDDTEYDLSQKTSTLHPSTSFNKKAPVNSFRSQLITEMMRARRK
jgi:hypothetical protein